MGALAGSRAATSPSGNQPERPEPWEAPGGRLCGALPSDRAAGTSNRLLDRSGAASAGGGPYEILNMARITGSSALQCGGTCSASSSPVTPSDHTSAVQSYPLSDASTSGASQYGEPMTVRRRASVPCSCVLTPRSPSFSVPSRLRKRLAALISRCTTCRACRYCSPTSDCHSAAAICGSANGASCLRMMSSKEPPSHSSVTIQRHSAASRCAAM